MSGAPLFPAPALPRRTLLRGAVGGLAAAVGLPLLDAMTGSGPGAHARARPPLRFGVFYWGGGIVKPYWVPTATGVEWELPDALTPFEALRPWLTLVTGASHGKCSPGHIPARGLALSGSHDLTRCQGPNCIGNYRGQAHPEPSVDALVAEAWRGRTVFDSVEIGICRKGPYKSNSSWKRGGSVYNRHEPSPQRLFDRLFFTHLPAEERARRLALGAALERSMLDGVRDEARRLQQRLGQRDRQRLDAHLDGLRGVERRVQERERLRAGSAERACLLAPPGRPSTADFGDGTGHDEKEAKSRLMSDLLAVALACDRTRVFSYEWSATQSHAVYWEVGARTEHHPMNHAVGDKPEYNATVRFIMKNFAYLAEALRAIPEGDGNLLDNTLILGTSEHGSSMKHDYEEHPYVLVGKAGGRLRAGQHHRLEGADVASGAKVLLTAARAVGVAVPALGQDCETGARRVRDGLGALEA